MMADSYRYTVEFEIDGAKKGAAENARKAYERASAAAEIGLAATQPSCLGLALNLIKQPLDKASGKWYAVAPEWSPVSRVREMQKRDKGHHRTTKKNTRRPPLPRVGGLRSHEKRPPEIHLAPMEVEGGRRPEGGGRVL